MAQGKRVTLVCEHCGKSYERYAWQADRSKYCCKTCKGMARRKRVTLICEICGQPYEVIASRVERSKYCSMACAGESRRAPQCES